MILTDIVGHHVAENVLLGYKIGSMAEKDMGDECFYILIILSYMDGSNLKIDAASDQIGGLASFLGVCNRHYWRIVSKVPRQVFIASSRRNVEKIVTSLASGISLLLGAQDAIRLFHRCSRDYRFVPCIRTVIGSIILLQLPVNIVAMGASPREQSRIWLQQPASTRLSPNHPIPMMTNRQSKVILLKKHSKKS